MLCKSLLLAVFCVVNSVFAHAPLSLEVDNGVVGEPEVQCGSDSISLIFNSRNPFAGKIFVKGFVADNDCVMMGDNKEKHRFTVKHDGCGVRRQREVNGVVIIATVIVSFHPIFITKVDRAYRLSCFYVEGTKKVQQQLDVAALTTQTVESQTQLPVCRYDILFEGPNGVPVKYGKIGDTIYHKWSCTTDLIDVYCMRVHSCTVYDGQGGPPVTVIDINGCSVDGVILQNLDYVDDLSAGKSAQVFKFADKAGLYFNCQIQLTIKDKQYGCANAIPQCGQTFVQSSPQTTEISSEYSNAHESGYPTQPSSAGYPTTVPAAEYDSESSRYPQPPVPFEVRPEYTKLDVEPTVAGAPGIRPTYQDLHPNNGTQDVGSLFPWSWILKGEYETVSPSYIDQNAYTRLIKRNVRVTATPNRTQPVAVADFDLPERGLIVFGLEDTNGEDQFNENAAHLIVQNRSTKTCFTTNKVMVFTAMSVTLFVALIIALALIVYKQRRLISSHVYLKH
ncbi:hypothetical protein Q1695_012820 [Nippostrongylus brasiliensis]|nr:hypothetical protein Q1695_012820 [Nippostrongylus brasiliensis]